MGQAIQRVAAARGRQRKKVERYLRRLPRPLEHLEVDLLQQQTFPARRQLAIRDSAIRRTRGAARRPQELRRRGLRQQQVDGWETYRYFAGCAWRVVTEIQEDAKSLLESEIADGS